MIEQQEDSFIICPICGQKLKALRVHVFYKHNMLWEDFKKKYPEIVTTQIAAKHDKVICPICGKEFKSKAGLGTHMAYIHKKTAFYGKTKNKHIKTEGILCPICHKYFTNFSQHIEMTHNMKWSEFVKLYNYTGPTRYITEDYKRHLSENKKNFYQNTVRGKELRGEASYNFKNGKNISQTKSAREKLSKFASNRSDNINFRGFGYNFIIKLNNHEYHLKSFIEFCCFIDLYQSNVKFDYEKINIIYSDEDNCKRLYKTDFVINNIIYEIKPFTFDKVIERAEKCQKYYNKDYSVIYKKYDKIRLYANLAGYKFIMVNHDSFCKELNIYKHEPEYYKNKILEFFELGILKKISINKKSNSNIKLFIEDEKFNKFKEQIEIKNFK